MKSRPIYENLDTSFVNVPALIRYLRRRRFAGRVRIELSGYEADVLLSAENQMRVREYDQIAGRVAEGEEALQRILIRSREPGGIVNVFQNVAETEPVAEIFGEVKNVQTPKVSATTNGSPAPVDIFANRNRVHSIPEPAQQPGKTSLPNLPFEFSNRVEAKAKQKSLSPEEAKLLLKLLGELLGTADRALSLARLNFAGAYQKSCMEICADFPFLMSLDYEKGRISVAEMPSANMFVAGVMEALRKILDKLAAHPKFEDVHRFTGQKLTALAQQRSDYYKRYGIETLLKRMLGV